jgi:hypothetical protein
MRDYYLRFPDQATMLEALRPLGMTYTTEATEDTEATEQISQGGHQYAAHEVGEIDGVEGWHYNLRVVNPEFDVSSLEQYAVTPANPRCVWA